MHVYEGHHRVYVARKVWKQPNREGINVACCTVERLMKALGLGGVRRDRRCVATVSDGLAGKPQDFLNRQFTAQRPNQLWVADITYVAT